MLTARAPRVVLASASSSCAPSSEAKNSAELRKFARICEIGWNEVCDDWESFSLSSSSECSENCLMNWRFVVWSMKANARLLPKESLRTFRLIATWKRAGNVIVSQWIWGISSLSKLKTLSTLLNCHSDKIEKSSRFKNFQQFNVFDRLYSYFLRYSRLRKYSAVKNLTPDVNWKCLTSDRGKYYDDRLYVVFID